MYISTSHKKNTTFLKTMEIEKKSDDLEIYRRNDDEFGIFRVTICNNNIISIKGNIDLVDVIKIFKMGQNMK